jgi:hypothetical protein
MSKPELVLSNTTSFFVGGIRAAFHNARKFGFKYLELVPYRWTKPDEVLHWAQAYQVKVAGIHLPEWWKNSHWHGVQAQKELSQKVFAILWDIYLGPASLSPSLRLAEMLKAKNEPFYLLAHSDLVWEMGTAFNNLAKKFHLVVENIPYHKRDPRFYWDPLEILRVLRDKNLESGLVFDIGHLHQGLNKQPSINIPEMYRLSRPEIIHISYNSGGIHMLPNPSEQDELTKLLRIHQPQYIVMETNPLVSIANGKQLLDKIIAKTV